MIAPLGEDLLDPVFLSHVALAQELDLHPVFPRQTLGILAQDVAKWLGKPGIVEDPNLVLIQIRGHALGKADLRQGAKY